MNGESDKMWLTMLPPAPMPMPAPTLALKKRLRDGGIWLHQALLPLLPLWPSPPLAVGAVREGPALLVVLLLRPGLREEEGLHSSCCNDDAVPPA